MKITTNGRGELAAWCVGSFYLALIGCKAFGLISVSWWVLAAPFWIGPAITLSFALVLLILLLVFYVLVLALDR